MDASQPYSQQATQATQPIASQDEDASHSTFYRRGPAREVIGTLKGITGKTAINHEICADDDFVIGRYKECAVVLDSLYASNKHTRIYTMKSDLGDVLVFCEDLSSNGTFWNGKRIGKGKSILLSSGDCLEIRKGSYLSFNQIADINSSNQPVNADLTDAKYQLTSRVLGSGAYATVYMAVDKETKQQLACKVMDKELFKMRGKSDFVKETQILQSISHVITASSNDPADLKPNVVKILDVIETDRRVYIFLELVSGGDLFNLVKENGAVEEGEAKFLFYQLLLAIKYLHDKNITHRDLKPENVLVATAEPFARLMVTDFGMARYVNAMSMMKSIVGTVTYVAPEVIETKYSGRGGYGKSADCWSLGVLLYVMLSAMHPFGDVDDSDDDEAVPESTYGVPPANEGYRSPEMSAADPMFTPSKDAANYSEYEVAVDNRQGRRVPAGAQSKAPAPVARAPTDVRILQRIAQGLVEFPSDPWDSISNSAKSLVMALMERKPEKRLTIEQALSHEWIASKKEELEQIYEQKLDSEWNIPEAKPMASSNVGTPTATPDGKVRVETNTLPPTTPFISPPGSKRKREAMEGSERPPLREYTNTSTGGAGSVAGADQERRPKVSQEPFEAKNHARGQVRGDREEYNLAGACVM